MSKKNLRKTYSIQIKYVDNVENSVEKNKLFFCTAYNEEMAIEKVYDNFKNKFNILDIKIIK